MRKPLPIYALIVLLSLFSKFLFAQVEEFSFEGAKVYPNGNKIAYFHLKGVKDRHQAFFIQKDIVNNQEINRFSFLSSTNNQSYCMVECSENISENTLKTLINQSIDKYYDKMNNSKNLREFYLWLYSIDDMPEYIDTGNRQKDVLDFKDRFEVWKSEHPDEYNKIRTLQLDIFIQ